MYVVYANNPDHGLYNGIRLLREDGKRMDSRVGPVLVVPRPVTTVYPLPRDRVSLSPLRDANPFFHLMEAMWMLAGRNDVEFVAQYAARMKEFSDDGATLNGAYGYRWRTHFDMDQLHWIAEDLKRDPNSRRAVLSMWDPHTDIDLAIKGGKDVPCNTQAYFRLQPSNKLDMTVTCRSNDIVWGAYGANVVHFSVLLEAMAALIGCDVGVYYQVSNNYHAYIEREDTKKLFDRASELLELRPEMAHITIEDTIFDEIEGAWHGKSISDIFLKMVVQPMLLAHQEHKQGNTPDAISRLAGSRIDWHVAGTRWLERRLTNKSSVAETRA
jgi:thymidylate synthase